jgi:hypothetical protein
LNSREKIATSFMGVVAMIVAVRVPVASSPISPKASPGPSERITSPSLMTSASPLSITKSS